MNSSTSYRAAMYRGAKDVVLRDVAFPPMAAGNVLFKIEACGICGTDIQAILRGSEEYVQVGHEVAGRVISADGSISPTTAVLESSSACGRCANCRNGEPDLCLDVKSFFGAPHFGLAEYMPSPEISVLEYSGLSPEVACLSEPLGVALDLCTVAEMNPRSVVLIAGLGPIGLMAVRLAKLAGAAKIYATTYSAREKRNALALEFGADELLFEDEVPLAERKLDPAPDRILSTVPPSFVGGCVAPAARGAIVTYIGVGHGETDHIRFPANDFHFKKMQLRSSFASPALRTPAALDLLRSGRVPGEKFITHRFPLADAAEAIRVACFDKGEAIKVVVMPEG